MESEFDILVICLANVCRSPQAERLLRLHLDRTLGSCASAIQVTSAGVLALVGQPMNEISAAELDRLGGDPSDFKATQLTAEMVAGADLVLVATTQLRSRVLEDSPRALRRTFTLREFARLSHLVRQESPDETSPVAFVKHAASKRGATVAFELNVADPIGRSERFHRDVAEVIELDCRTISLALGELLLKNTHLSAE